MANDRFNLCKRSLAFKQRLRRNLSYIKDKRKLNSKINLAINERSLFIEFVVTDGTRANCKEVIHLIKNTGAKLLLEDKVYNTNKILPCIAKRNMK